MALSTTWVWLIFASVMLVIIVALVTLAILLVLRSQGVTPSAFSCSIPTPAPAPQCKNTSVTSGVPGALGSGFLTNTSLQVFPTLVPTQSTTPTPPLIGYYHSHPTAYYRQSPSGALYSYPFVLQMFSPGSPTAAPFMHLAAARTSPDLTDVSNSPFQQFSYLSTSLDTETNGYPIGLPCAFGTTPNMIPFAVDREPYPSAGGPTLSSELSSIQGSPGHRKVRVLMNQGTPYITVIFNDIISSPTTVSLISTAGYGTHTITQIVVAGPPSRTYDVYSFSKNPSNPTRYMTWYVDHRYASVLIPSGNESTLQITVPGTGETEAVIYITMFAQVGPLLSMVEQLVANSLVPHFIQLADIIPSGDRTAIQYTVAPVPGLTSGYQLQSGSSTLWIVPPTCFQTAALGAITLPGIGYFDFPVGNGMFQTNPQVGPAAFTSFFTLWPPPGQQISDFTSYALQNSGSGVHDTNNSIDTDLDMYDLALAIRVLTATSGAQPATREQINSAVTIWQTKLSEMGVGESDYTLFTENLGPQDAGLVSRVAYLLLTAIHLNAVSGILPNTGSANGYITAFNPQLTMLIESGLTTVSLQSQASSSLGKKLYTPLAFLDSYSCTVPVIKTVGYSTPPNPTPTQLTSRLGEVLGYLWASDFLVSNGFVMANTRIPALSRTLYSIVLESTTRLLQGQCPIRSVPNLSPVMPWTTNISHTAIGFQLDGATPGGTSPDATLLQTFTPFTPPSHLSIRQYLTPLTIAVDKLLHCKQRIPQSPPAVYAFVSFVDPELVGYYAYLYTTGDQTSMLLSGKVSKDLTSFIKTVDLQHPAVALMMNQAKLNVTTQVLVTRF